MDRTAAALVVCLALALVAVPPASAEHGSPSNFTIIPYDHQPGIGDATYEQHATAPVSIEYLDYIGATWKEGGFTGCAATNIDTFGIDRDNDQPGTATDEGLAQYVESSEVGEDEFVANFYEKDAAFGTSTNLAAGDEFVSVTENCFDNPGDPGWYQIQSSIGGTAPNGTYIEATDVSHYFYVCDCAGEQAARQQLGPPPSEPTPTPSPTATADPTPTRTPPEGTPFPSPTPTATPKQATATPGPATDAGGGGSGSDAVSTSGEAGTPSATGTPTATPPDWDEYVRETPTVGSGPGFGGVAALVALAAAAMLALRRR
ncbi:PGF-CTERM sorting domain-containing protein [Halorarius halobius]|uniref:PGF-CTERM sorting domain-containing protein n=1 Tax=Halorarius halobius TaxID=2962671 RepID=UPI0025768F50|nr:PGF-CTERM sorting domain-containing protein [Halorarius halobius]